MVHNKEAIVIVIVIVIIVIVKNSWHGSDTLAREIFTFG